MTGESETADAETTETTATGSGYDDQDDERNDEKNVDRNDEKNGDQGDKKNIEKLPSGTTQTGMPANLEKPDRFDWRGWLVVAVVFISFLVIPAFVLYLPEAHHVLTFFGFSRRQAYVVFPMIPAILLGITAIWAAVHSHSSGK